MKKYLILLLFVCCSTFGHAQPDLKLNLKQFIDDAMNGAEILKQYKYKIFLDGQEIKNPEAYDFNRSELKTFKIKKVKRGQPEVEEIDFIVSTTKAELVD